MYFRWNSIIPGETFDYNWKNLISYTMKLCFQRGYWCKPYKRWLRLQQLEIVPRLYLRVCKSDICNRYIFYAVYILYSISASVIIFFSITKRFSGGWRYWINHCMYMYVCYSTLQWKSESARYCVKLFVQHETEHHILRHTRQLSRRGTMFVSSKEFASLERHKTLANF